MEFSETLKEILKRGGCAVIPTDTIYGIVTTAVHQASVERVYAIKGRSPQKPCIILIEDAARMQDFGVEAEYIERVQAYLAEGPTSFIVPITRTDLGYLDRGTRTLAFRIPEPPELRALLVATGPLIAPSANPEGMPPATTIHEAREYFGDRVDAYSDGGTRVGSPSALIDVRAGIRLR